jgi:hypothetical protein
MISYFAGRKIHPPYYIITYHLAAAPGLYPLSRRVRWSSFGFPSLQVIKNEGLNGSPKVERMTIDPRKFAKSHPKSSKMELWKSKSCPAAGVRIRREGIIGWVVFWAKRFD